MLAYGLLPCPWVTSDEGRDAEYEFHDIDMKEITAAAISLASAGLLRCSKCEVTLSMSNH